MVYEYTSCAPIHNRSLLRSFLISPSRTCGLLHTQMQSKGWLGHNIHSQSILLNRGFNSWLGAMFPIHLGNDFEH